MILNAPLSLKRACVDRTQLADQQVDIETQQIKHRDNESDKTLVMLCNVTNHIFCLDGGKTSAYNEIARIHVLISTVYRSAHLISSHSQHSIRSVYMRSDVSSSNMKHARLKHDVMNMKNQHQQPLLPALRSTANKREKTDE